MFSKSKISDSIRKAYPYDGNQIFLGKPVSGNKCLKDVSVGIPPDSFLGHGIISGSGGTGKSRTVQLLMEGLSKRGIPALMMDLRGNLSGVAREGITTKYIKELSDCLGTGFKPGKFPVEFLSLSQKRV
jgi:uncharacterized protein